MIFSGDEPFDSSVLRGLALTSFSVIGRNRVLLVMAGSITGTFIGGQLLGLVPIAVLLQLLAAILIISAVKIWRRAVQKA